MKFSTSYCKEINEELQRLELQLISSLKESDEGKIYSLYSKFETIWDVFLGPVRDSSLSILGTYQNDNEFVQNIKLSTKLFVCLESFVQGLRKEDCVILLDEYREECARSYTLGLEKNYDSFLKVLNL